MARREAQKRKGEIGGKRLSLSLSLFLERGSQRRKRVTSGRVSSVFFSPLCLSSSEGLAKKRTRLVRCVFVHLLSLAGCASSARCARVLLERRVASSSGQHRKKSQQRRPTTTMTGQEDLRRLFQPGRSFYCCDCCTAPSSFPRASARVPWSAVGFWLRRRQGVKKRSAADSGTQIGIRARGGMMDDDATADSVDALVFDLDLGFLPPHAPSFLSSFSSLQIPTTASSFQ